MVVLETKIGKLNRLVNLHESYSIFQALSTGVTHGLVSTKAGTSHTHVES